MSHTDRVLDAICNKMDRLIENQKQIERRLASLERVCAQQGKSQKKAYGKRPKTGKGINPAGLSENKRNRIVQKKSRASAGFCPEDRL